MKQKTNQISSESFAKVKGSPGEAPRLTGLLRSFWPFFLIFAAAGYLLRAAWPHPELSIIQTGFLLLMLAGSFAATVMSGERRLKRYLKGARGEENVGRTLSFLPHGYHVFHGVSLQPSGALKSTTELDHIVIGPSGIFIVETKNWSGTITVREGEVLYNGHQPDRPPVEQAKKEALALEETLGSHLKINVNVQAILCFAGSRIQDGFVGVNGVVVCDASALNQVVMDTVDAPLGGDIQKESARFIEQLIKDGQPG